MSGKKARSTRTRRRRRVPRRPKMGLCTNRGVLQRPAMLRVMAQLRARLGSAAVGIDNAQRCAATCATHCHATATTTPSSPLLFSFRSHVARARG